MTISAITISGEQYTIYADRREANAYLAVDPVRKATWEALTDDDDNRGPPLVASTRRLDLLSWAGKKAGGALQENQWPRTGLTYPDGTAVADDEVPKAVENACILLAGSIAITAASADAGTSGSNQKRVKAGSAEIEFFRPEDGVALQDKTAWELIFPFLASDSAKVGPLVSGTGGESAFTDGWGLNKGLS